VNTSYSVVVQPQGADRTFWHHAGANAEFDGTTVDLTDAGMLHVGYPPLLSGLLPHDGLPLRRLLERARIVGVTTSMDMAVVDPNSDVGRLDWRAILDNVAAELDVFSPSLDDLTSALGIREEFSEALVERLAEELIESGVAIVLISAGDQGMFLRTAPAERLATGGSVLDALPTSWAGKSFWQRPFRVHEVVTTNGAGDAATAGLLFGLWSKLEPTEATRYAAACGAVIVSGRATTPSNVSELLGEESVLNTEMIAS
jgi:sugar/nucleoside kinase (ribokinase family)